MIKKTIPYCLLVFKIDLLVSIAATVILFGTLYTEHKHITINMVLYDGGIKLLKSIDDFRHWGYLPDN